MTDTKTLLANQKTLLRTRMAELRAEIAELMAPTVKLKAERDDAIAQQNALAETIAGLTAQIDAIEQPKLHALKTELAEVARAEIAIKVDALNSAV